MNISEITISERIYYFGLQRLEDAFRTIDSGCELVNKILFVDCNKEGYKQVEDYILNGVHAIWKFEIITINEDSIRISYMNIPICISYSIKGSY